MIFGLTRFDKPPDSKRNFVLIFTLVFTASLFGSGCGKSKQSAQIVENQNINSTAADQMPEQPTAATSAAVAVQPNGEPDLKELNRSLLRWILGNRRRPKNFEDFAATAGVVIPPPPTGKKYIIAKDMHIQLVDR